ncbi:circularly permuted type 2 ATP-grasp protein [Aquisalimonas lutea]|uniref:circularly permuted type 2 ATP-grasp protein n=1 Tax=Aquisalimonas lutea TaxID=1327750 RepID=UPI0025B358C6|nr:circularly permuted type 2 ATP-grasp protein [Aquisalimonas lutea]MDN3516487.1 circularly permuted type 2 ATP-grasp protein [Aquisalimonas lutea]
MSAIPQSPLLDAYRRRAGPSDEMFSSRGEVNGVWQYVAEALDTLGIDTLRQRHEQARRLLRERGVTYNVYGDSQGVERSWDLDPIPVLIGSDEWAQLEAELQRRAELFNLILKDLYGPQELLRRGLLPPELVYAHGGFLRPCYPFDPEPAHPLTLHAVDLARTPEGRIHVVADRTQSPSGAGYALENRVVMSRAMPSLFRESHVHRLALFFQNLRSSLAALAPERDRDEPNVVVLTPGPLNETYFEHSFLASYLGYTLVEGGDLTVRDGRVWLRSMGRLEPVDVILRRLDEDYCDALELRSDSLLGVPGLVEAVRRGRVAVVNPLGSGILENPALNAFLPGIARHFLGQELDLPGLPTWWCGDPDSREHVLAHLGELVIKPVDRRSGEPTTFGGALDRDGRRQLAERIRRNPHQFAAQEQGRFSSVPTLGRDGLEPRSAVLRTFLVGRPDGYAVMPGGLTRIAPGPDEVNASNQAGGLSKDTWVVASEPVREASLLATEEGEDAPTDRSAALPPAATENLFWMARYAERAEHGLRLIRLIFDRLHTVRDDEDPLDRSCLEQLLMALTRVTATGPGFLDDATLRGDPVPELLSVLNDGARTGSVAFNLHAMLGASHAVRDRLSRDIWRVLGTIRTRLAEGRSAEPGAELDEVITLLAALRGLQEDTMVHSQAWSFLEMGRCIERGLLTSQFLRATMVTARDTGDDARVPEAVLSHLESINAYRRQYHERARVLPVLDLVLLSETNPRSVGYQLARLKRALKALPSTSGDERLSAQERLVLEAHTALRLSDPGALAAGRETDDYRGELDQLLVRITHLLDRASRSLGAAYFTDPVGPRPLGPASPETTESA